MVSVYQFVSNAEVKRTSGQPLFDSAIQARHLSLFGHIARLDDIIIIIISLLIHNIKRT